ncbi:hypothetical protein BGW39_006543 [Mortierella sp. 14UC]|nr:hypothetical protein BGW39_006543 [Mortierella sp. 14UC]
MLGQFFQKSNRVLAFVLMGVEMVEMALREPILDYLLPENEMTLYIAGFSIVAGAFGFAVAYNLLVGQDDAIKEDGDDEARRSGGGNGRDSGPRTTSPSLLRPTDNMLGQNSGHPVVPQQQVRRPRLMFTKASTYLLNGNAIFLAVLLFVFTIAIAQRSAHLSQMDKELNNAWTDSIRHRTSLISDFELRHRCCGYDSITNRPFPPIVTKPPKEGEEPKPQTCHENPAYGFKVPCKAELHKDFGRWQKRIQQLLLVQVTMMVPLLLLVMTLSAIGISKLRERKQEGLEEAEAQTEGTATVPVMVNGRELPLLVDVAPHNDGMPILIDVDAEPVRVAQDRRPVVQPTLI